MQISVSRQLDFFGAAANNSTDGEPSGVSRRVILPCAKLPEPNYPTAYAARLALIQNSPRYFMSDASLTCPFCNAVVSPAGIVPGSGRAICSRCGDSFAVKATAANSSSGASAKIDDEMDRHRRARQVRAKRSVKSKLFLAIGLGIAGAIVGLCFNEFQSKPNHQLPTTIVSSPPVAPIEMLMLRYLPAGTDSVIALQLPPFLESLPPSENHDARSALVNLGISDELLKYVESFTGIGLEAIDQLAIGLALRDGSIGSQPVLAIRTRASFSLEDLSRRSKLSVEKRGDRTYYRTPELTQLRLRFYWWSPSDRILLAALQEEQLDGIPENGMESTEHLSPKIVESTQKFLTADTYCWAVLNSDHWETMAMLALFATQRIESMGGLIDPSAMLKTLVLGIRVEHEPILSAWLELKSENAATDLRKWLIAKYKDEDGRISVGGAGNTVMVRTPTSGGGVLLAIQKALPGKKKK
jgi:transcription elongation factor Elf1